MKFSLKNTIFIAFIASLLCHFYLLFGGFDYLYNYINSSKLSEQDLQHINNISKSMQLVMDKPTATKEKINQVFDKKNNAMNNPTNIESLIDYRLAQDELNKFSKYTDEDKQIIQNEIGNNIEDFKESKNEKSNGNESFQRFIDKQGNSEKRVININSVSAEDLSLIKEKYITKSHIEECDFHYLGIGVAYGFRDNSTEERLNNGFWRVSSIANGYGADLAGIKVGDKILGVFDNNGYFHEGVDFIKDNTAYENKKIKVLINRNGSSINKDVKISKICYKP